MSPAFRILYTISLVSTFICAFAHLSTFFGYAFFGILWFAFFLFVLWPMVIWQWRKVPRHNLVLEIYGSIPMWMKVATIGLIAYCFIIYFSCYGINAGGSPVKLPDGRFVIRKGEQIVRVLTEQEYLYSQVVLVRMVTGELLGFYGLAAITLKALWIKSGPAMADAKVSGN